MIASMHLPGFSMRAMTRVLGRSPATVNRELVRNCGPDSYASAPAQVFCATRRVVACHPTKLDPQGVTWRIVLTLLDWKWSPWQISGTFRRMHPNDSTQQVSHATIYARPYWEGVGNSSRVCGTIIPIACQEAGARTGAARSLTW